MWIAWPVIRASLHLKVLGAASLDHLVGACEERGWESEAERIGRFQVQHEVEARGLFDWQFARRDPSQDAVDVKGRAPPQVGSVDRVSNQSSGSSISDVADDSRESIF